MGRETYKFTCCICHKHIVGEYGHNPFPIFKAGECCDMCATQVVIPARIKHFKLQKLC